VLAKWEEKRLNEEKKRGKGLGRVCQKTLGRNNSKREDVIEGGPADGRNFENAKKCKDGIGRDTGWLVGGKIKGGDGETVKSTKSGARKSDPGHFLSTRRKVGWEKNHQFWGM